jgi:heme/copper-type cytochrome/quinol oxidase subunit 3
LGSTGWPDPSTVLSTGLLGVNTFVLICSSLTFVLAVESAKKKEAGKTRRFLLLTALFGAAFLAIKGFDYAHLWHEGFRLDTNLFGLCYYLLTGFHGLHVLTGIILILYLAAAVGRPGFIETHAERVESSGLYWHFIDIVWVILFAVLCLI